jgi:hypothetical protein
MNGSNNLLSPADNKPFHMLALFQKSKCKDLIKGGVWYQRALISSLYIIKTE